MLSLFKSLYARLQAWQKSVPYRFDRLWISGKRYQMDDNELFQDKYELMSFSGRGSSGDVFGLLREDGKRHLYEIEGRFHPGGSDHFISPYKYDLRYVGTMSELDYQEMKKEIEQAQKRPQLLQLW